MADAEISLSPDIMAKKIQIISTSATLLAHTQEAMMEEMASNNNLLKALISRVDILAQSIERLQAAALAGSASSPANEAKAKDTKADPDTTFQDKSVSTDHAPISAVSEIASLTETAESQNEDTIFSAEASSSREPFGFSRRPMSYSSTLTSLHSSSGGPSDHGVCVSSPDQIIESPVDIHASKEKAPAYKRTVPFGSFSSEDAPVVISTTAPSKSAKRRLNRNKKMQNPVEIQPIQTRFGRTSRPRERYDSSAGSVLLPRAREDLLNSALKRETDARMSQEFVPADLLTGPPRKRQKMMAEVVMIDTSRSNEEKLAVPRLLDFEFPCGDDTDEAEAMLEDEDVEMRTSSGSHSRAGSPRNDFTSEESSEFALPSPDSTHALDDSSSDLTDPDDLDDLVNDGEGDDRSSNFSDMYMENPHPFVIPEPRENPDSEYRPSVESDMEAGPSRSPPDIMAYHASSLPRTPALSRLATENPPLTPPPTAPHNARAPSLKQSRPSPPRFKHEAVDQKIRIVPVDGVRRRLKGFAPHVIDLTPTIRDICITRRHFSSVYGGNSRALCPSISAHKRAETGYADFLFPTRRMNPHVPAAPGQPGLLCRTTDAAPWGERVMKLLVTAGCKDGMWCYMGEYALVQAEPLSSDEWLQLPARTRQIWVRALLRSKQPLNKRVRARITLRHRLEKEPTEDEVAELVIHPTDTWDPSEEQVHAAYDSGAERIRIWVLHCVGYDEAFQRDILSRYSAVGNGHAAPQGSSGRRSRRSGDDDEEPPKKKQRRSSTKIPALQTSNHQKTGELATPKRRGRPPKLLVAPNGPSLKPIATESDAKLARERESGALALPSPPASLRKGSNEVHATGMTP